MKLIYHFMIAVTTGVVVGPTTWMLFDRDPPYIRESGEIFPVSHKMCGLDTGPPHHDDVIRPGSCVEVKWTITPLRTCKPYEKFNIKRAIIDQQGRHVLPATVSLYSARSHTIPPDRSSTENLARYFTFPINGPVGPGEYEVAASFACNKLQEFFWPITVDKPNIKYMVGEPAVRGPK